MPFPTLFGQVQLVASDLREQTRSEFLATLALYGGHDTRLLRQESQYTLLFTLAQDLKLSAEQQQHLCAALAEHYSLAWLEIDHTWLHAADRTIQAVHERLWHKANLQSGLPIPYPS